MHVVPWQGDPDNWVLLEMFDSRAGWDQDGSPPPLNGGASLTAATADRTAWP